MYAFEFGNQWLVLVESLLVIARSVATKQSGANGAHVFLHPQEIASRTLAMTG